MAVEIPSSVLDAPVAGVNLQPGRLAEQCGEEPVLLLFLRHFGCIFCRETIADVRRISEERSDFPPTLFFTQAGTTETRAFLRRYWPTARAISDPHLNLYDAFGVRRGSLLESLGPSVLRAKKRASQKGHENGPRDGDIWRLPGAMLLRQGRVLWRYEPRHAADHPDFESIPAILAQQSG